jgi:hypothetical protein
MFSGACTAKEFSGSTDKGTYGLSNIVFMVLQQTRKHHTTQPCTPGSILFTAAIEPSPKIFQSKLCADPTVGQRIRTEFSNTCMFAAPPPQATQRFVYTCTLAGSTMPLLSLCFRAGDVVYVSCSMICAPVIGRYTTARMSHSRITMPNA